MVDIRTRVRVALAGRFLAEQITVGISRASCKKADAERVKTTVLFLWAICSAKSFLGNPSSEVSEKEWKESNCIY